MRRNRDRHPFCGTVGFGSGLDLMSVWSWSEAVSVKGILHPLVTANSIWFVQSIASYLKRFVASFHATGHNG